MIQEAIWKMAKYKALSSLCVIKKEKKTWAGVEPAPSVAKEKKKEEVAGVEPGTLSSKAYKQTNTIGSFNVWH